MPKFIVTKREVWTQQVEVDASSEFDATRLVANGQGRVLEDSFEYSHDLSRDNWTTEVATSPSKTLGKCSVCQKQQVNSPGGVTCPEGHGGAPSMEE